MFCKNCGKEIGEANFCPHCGQSTHDEQNHNTSNNVTLWQDVKDFFKRNEKTIRVICVIAIVVSVFLIYCSIMDLSISGGRSVNWKDGTVTSTVPMNTTIIIICTICIIISIKILKKK